MWLFRDVRSRYVLACRTLTCAVSTDNNETYCGFARVVEWVSYCASKVMESLGDAAKLMCV